MSREALPVSRQWTRSVLLFAAVVAVALTLGAWKYLSIKDANAAAANQPEPMESVVVAVATEREHRDATTSIGTVLALRSVTLRNEVSGTVRAAMLTPGLIVEAGTVLVALDVTVEEAELKAQEAQAALTETVLARVRRLMQDNAAAQVDLDRARAQYDVALAQIDRTKAIIARKTIRAPFRAKIGMADVHPGQYLSEGSLLTTLQGVEAAAHVDFTVAQHAAAGLHEGDIVAVFTDTDTAPISARILAIDARIDPATRNATVRARTIGGKDAPAPGASVRVRVPVGPARKVVVVPVSAMRRGPGGDHVYVIAPGQDGRSRVQVRPVRSGAVLGDEVVVLEGLAAGEQVAAAGSFKLRDSALVVIAADSAASGIAPK